MQYASHPLIIQIYELHSLSYIRSIPFTPQTLFKLFIRPKTWFIDTYYHNMFYNKIEFVQIV